MCECAWVHFLGEQAAPDCNQGHTGFCWWWAELGSRYGILKPWKVDQYLHLCTASNTALQLSKLFIQVCQHLSAEPGMEVLGLSVLWLNVAYGHATALCCTQALVWAERALFLLLNAAHMVLCCIQACVGVHTEQPSIYMLFRLVASSSLQLILQ